MYPPFRVATFKLTILFVPPPANPPIFSTHSPFQISANDPCSTAQSPYNFTSSVKSVTGTSPFTNNVFISPSLICFSLHIVFRRTRDGERGEDGVTVMAVTREGSEEKRM